MAARSAFAERGIDVSMTAVARRAGVGPATLYRHFPSRGALITVAFSEQFDACEAMVDQALADPDPWHGFCTVLGTITDLQSGDRAFTGAFLAQFADAVDFDQRLDRIQRKLAALVRRAQASGRLRADFDPADLTLVVVAMGGLVDTLGADAPGATRRLLGYLLRSFRADVTGPLPPAPGIGLDRVHGAGGHLSRPG